MRTMYETQELMNLSKKEILKSIKGAPDQDLADHTNNMADLIEDRFKELDIEHVPDLVQGFRDIAEHYLKEDEYPDSATYLYALELKLAKVDVLSRLVLDQLT